MEVRGFMRMLWLTLQMPAQLRKTRSATCVEYLVRLAHAFVHVSFAECSIANGCPEELDIAIQ